jgi:predicted ATPase
MMVGTMRLCTLGGLALVGLDFANPKPLLLLAYLAVEGPSERRHLAQLFWPGTINPLGNLSTALARLRGAHPDLVGADGVRAWTTVSADVRDLLDALDRGDPLAAIGLYRGRFLDGVHPGEASVELEAWLYERREALGERLAQALLTVAERAAAAGDFTEAGARATAAYLLSGAPEPTPDDLERLHTLLRAADLTLAADVRRESEGYGLTLDLSPARAREALRNTTTSAATSEAALPRPPTPFVGREEELATLATLLERHEGRLVTLVGPGGIGKTRLAIEAATRRRRAYRDGIVYASLVDVDAPEHLVYALTEAFGVSLEGGDAPHRRLIEQLRGRDTLLVLDNLEHLLGGTQLIAELLEAASGVTILATSRVRLGLLREQLIEIAGLRYPEADADGDEGYDAVALLTTRIGLVRPDPPPSRADRAAIARICRLVGGMPLALELAAGWLRTLTLDAVADEIESGLDLLRTTAHDMPARFRSIRAVFDRSWQLLDDAERSALARLSVFRGGFRRDAAAAVADADLGLLAQLIDRSLLSRNGERYVQHPLLLEYGRERLAADPDDQRRTRNRHADYAFAFIASRERGRWGTDVPELLAEYDAELENLRAAWRWAIAAARSDDLQRSTEAFMWYFDIRTRLQDGVDHFGEAVDAFDRGAPEHRSALGSILALQGHLLYRQGRQDAATRLAERGLALGRSLGDTEAIMNALFVLGTAAELRGDYPNARRSHQEALVITRELDRPYLMIAMKNLANVEWALGQLDRARALFTEALALSRQQGNPLGVVIVLSHFGALTLLTDGPDAARPLLHEGLDLAREIGFVHEISNLQRSLAQAAFADGDLSQARTLLTEALERARETGYRTAEALTLTALGRLAAKQDGRDEAERCYRRSLAIAWENREIPSALETLLRYSTDITDANEQVSARLDLIVRHPASPHRVRVEAWRRAAGSGEPPDTASGDAEAATTELGRLLAAISSTPPT